jgi:hypothetical protein
MKKLAGLYIILSFLNCEVQSQKQTTTIRQMIWGPDYQVYMKMDNDSSYNFEISKLYHASDDNLFNHQTEFVYYPVSFEQSYIDSLLLSASDTNDYSHIQKSPQIRKVTLWGSVGQSIGGGWVNFINCLQYALETRQLELNSPLLKRPESAWKPNPVTETYKRTRKWKYYVPVTQHEAKHEYKIRKRNNQLGDLKSIPSSYISLMQHTSDSHYKKLLKNHDYPTLAKIDLVKLLLGSPYLSETQIDYIKSRVLLSISKYNAKRMPTVLIFDRYQAAVAMSLDGTGYKADKIVFHDQQSMSPQEIIQRSLIIRGLVALINESNNKAFKERLNSLYKK